MGLVIISGFAFGSAFGSVFGSALGAANTTASKAAKTTCENKVNQYIWSCSVNTKTDTIVLRISQFFRACQQESYYMGQILREEQNICLMLLQLDNILLTFCYTKLFSSYIYVFPDLCKKIQTMKYFLKNSCLTSKLYEIITNTFRINLNVF